MTRNLVAKTYSSEPSLSLVKASKNPFSSVNFLAQPDFSWRIRSSKIAIAADARRSVH